jgi:Lon protease-like protein
MKLPSRVGVMTLPNAILFPQALLPLYIFEPRYREMLAQSLEEQRMFAIALLDASETPHAIGGVGLIRACVHNKDGTSNLVLQGLSRVRFTEFVQTAPYYIGEIEPLITPSLEEDDVEADALVVKIIEIVGQAQAKGDKVPDWMMQFMNDLKDFDVLADLVSYTFVEDIPTKQAILEELNIKKRLQKVLKALNRQSPPGAGFSF